MQNIKKSLEEHLTQHKAIYLVHQKDELIAESLGSFFHFERFLPPKVRYQLQQVYQDFKLDLLYPTVYPALQDLPVQADKTFVEGFKLFQDTERREMVLASEEVPCV